MMKKQQPQEMKRKRKKGAKEVEVENPKKELRQVGSQKEPQPKEEEDQKDKELARKLERFSDPHKRKKRKLKAREKEDEEERKRRKLVEANKKWAANEFNREPSEEERRLWTHQWKKRDDLKLEDLKQSYNSVVRRDNAGVTFQPRSGMTGLDHIFEFVEANKHYDRWFKTKLRDMGWSSNMTGYDPLAVSHSIKELHDSYMQCYGMLVKQTLWMLGCTSADMERLLYDF